MLEVIHAALLYFCALRTPQIISRCRSGYLIAGALGHGALTTRLSMSRSIRTDEGQAPPRLSASLIIVNAHNEILLVHRNPDSRTYGGAHVQCFAGPQALIDRIFRFFPEANLMRVRMTRWP
jgi:hypothetical protein